MYQDIVAYASTEAETLNTSKLVLHAYVLYLSLQSDT